MGNRIKYLKIHLGETVQIAFAQLKDIQNQVEIVTAQLNLNWSWS